MNAKEITSLSLRQLSDCLRSGELTAVQAAEAYLASIRENDPSIRAYLSILEEKAMGQAAETDRRRARGETLSPLAGVPVGIKDNICTKGVTTTCASRMLEQFIPPYNAHVIEKLEEAGAVTLGKLNMDEFAMGSSTENSFFQITHNPRDPSRVPGGSSGGSAAAVAANEAAFALGSDTGGSIRQPAAFCGVVGMKPTYGTVSRYGLIAFASSLDQIGPLTRDVADSAMVMDCIAGHDSRDSTSIRMDKLPYASQLGQDIRGIKIALPEEFFGEGLSEDVRKGIQLAARRFQDLGAEIVRVSMPALTHALPAYYIISSAEASSNLARFDGIRYGYRSPDYEDISSLYKNSRSEGFGEEVKRRIMLGTFALSSGYYDAYYKKALQVRTLITRDYSRIFAACDCILSPVAPTTAYKIGEKTANPLEMYLGDIYTVPVNIAGLPGLSMPCGAAADGLPVGMQLIGPAFSEPLLYRVGYAYETDCQPS
ncbi:MAG TPA: Asp-tRNA(Asn)/Glu-tRNA(Gln) amidotransferase subunit GatA [Candidatus Faecivivens stercoravium]|uniref:Glutamyl-tRNA(Gln) amidotransferase subunit A n=1 Tax=Candidatus Faecivivens stercoravium TaxID=2840803 RepID=A0A9D1DVY3_9FIRM|nr:Asp-tRNA(Asn)/Glu-tRNA(Gln) amidotransferase subunit GatA [Candidatus Faecivivens stercoravium]